MATKMTEKEEIEKLKNRIKELEEKAKRKQVNSALQFFKKNKIVDLLGSPEKLKEFTTEVMPSTSEPVVLRGGIYGDIGPAGQRYDIGTSGAGSGGGFRATLFLK